MPAHGGPPPALFLGGFWDGSALVKNLPAMRETWVRSLGGEDPLEKGMATHSSILAWRIPRTTVGDQYATAEQWGNNSRKNEETEPKSK